MKRCHNVEQQLLLLLLLAIKVASLVRHLPDVLQVGTTAVRWIKNTVLFKMQQNVLIEVNRIIFFAGTFTDEKGIAKQRKVTEKGRKDQS